MQDAACKSESTTTFVCVWEMTYAPGSDSTQFVDLPAPLRPSIVDLAITTDSPFSYGWAFCFNPSGPCPSYSAVAAPPPATSSSTSTHTLLIDFSPDETYHYMLGAVEALSPLSAPTPGQVKFRTEARFHELTSAVPSGGHAGSRDDPQLRDGVGDATASSGDITGGWLDQPFLDNELVEVGLVLPNLREVQPRSDEKATFAFSFTVIGETYVVTWRARGKSVSGDCAENWAANVTSPHETILLPCTIDLVNGTISTSVPLRLLGEPRPDDLFTDFAARSTRSADPGCAVVPRACIGGAPDQDATTTIDDGAITMARPFAIGGPIVWDGLRGIPPPQAPAPAQWATAPLASHNLPLTLLVAGVMLLAAVGGTSLAVVRRRVARLAPRAGPLVVAPGALVLGKYRVERALGSGGGGRAFLATDVRMKRNVVLKLIEGRDTAAAIREARAAAIDHPNVVRVYDVEETGDRALLVMEFVDGGSLKDRFAASGALSAGAFARVADDLLAGLEAVHATDAVHRDIKPGNVLLTREGRAKLADFGIARLPGFETTMGGAASGTVQYMSPEQARGKRVTAVSDLYSAAATLYEARTGRPLVEPHPDESAAEMQMRVGAGRAFDGDVEPALLRAWFSRALAVDPRDRYQNAGEMRVTLAAALSGSSP